jgi:signal transduction histidine kinase/ligand-binding sensor domain-containing protein/CheY-like chemotaxis protein
MKPFFMNFRKEHRSFWRILLAGVLSVGCFLPDYGFALNPARDILQYNCQSWSRQNGLPANGINAIAQTRDGYLWLGTTVGLVRFDGAEFKLFDLSNVPQVRDSTVMSLADAKNGGLWVGLENNAFGFYDGQSFSFRGRDNFGKENMNVRTILQSKDGTIWLAAERMASRLTPSGNFEEVLGSSTNYTVNVLCGYEDSQGRVWFGTAGTGVYYWHDGKITQLADPSLDGLPVNCIAEDMKGQIWVGTEVGLYCYDSNLKKKDIPPLTVEIKTLLVDRHGVLWIGTSGDGLARYKDEQYGFLRKTDGLTSDYVKSLAEDREGSLWIGTRDGLNQLTDVKFPTYQAAEDPTVKDALSVSASRKGGVWVGSSAGLTYFDGKPKTYGAESGLTNAYVKRVFEASNGDVYFVNGASNLEVFSGGKVVATYAAPNMVVGLAEDEHGVVASVGANLYRVGTNYFRPYIFTNGQPTLAWVLNLASGRDGEIWVACGAGIFRVKDGRFQQWMPEPPASPVVQWVCEDSDGVIWGAQLTGIVRLKNNQLRYISRKDGLFDNDIYSIVPDDFGNLWVDSGRGIFRVSRKSMNDFADGKTDHVECAAYDGPESVKPADKTTQEHVGCKTSDGRIWFPSAHGVIEIDPAHITMNQQVPPVHIESVSANGIELARSKNLVVPPGRGELEFHYTALSFIAPQKIRFRYQLEGYDNDWVEAGNRRMAFYTNLKPGNYTFRVIAANADGVWNQTGDFLRLELRPYFYQTVWFHSLCGALLLAALFGTYLWRVNHLTRKQQALQKARNLLEVEVQKRTAELARSNEALRTENTERKRAEQRLSVEYAISRILAESPSWKQAIPQVLKTICDIFKWDVGTAWLTDHHAGVLRLDEIWNEPNLSIEPFKKHSEQMTFMRGVGLPGRVWASGKAVWISDVAQDADFSRAASATQAGLHGAFAFPVLIGNGVGGIVEFFSREIRGLDEDLSRSFANIGNQLGQFFERKRVEGHLFQSQKMETVGKLAGGIAHEFNSIMTAIIGESELLLTDLPPENALAKNATGIRKAAERAATLTRQLLAYGRKQFLRPEILDLNAVLTNMETMVRHLMGKNVDVRIVPTDGLATVKADSGQVEQVIMNVAMNAADAMPNAGKLTLETANVVLDAEYVSHVPELKAGDYVMLAITDTGAGMSEDVKSRVFEPFFTTKGVGKGTGLGLSTCHGIIKQSGGHIAVYSEPGRGATFKIYLPQAEPPKQAPAQRRDSVELPRGTETILLVEDDPSLREMAGSLLQRLGYTVLTAANGIEALTLAHQQSTGYIDLLFTDVVMPHMSGKELSDRVRSLFPKTKILFTSAYTENAIVHQGALNPGVELLQKPFTPSALAHKVREMLKT